MQTSIGRTLSDSPRLLNVACVVNGLLLLFDLWLSYLFSKSEILNFYYHTVTQLVSVIAIVLVVVTVVFAGGDLASLGFRLTPVQGWKYWFKATLWLGAIIVACIIVGGAIMLLSGYRVPMEKLSTRIDITTFVHSCVYAPIIEEATWRVGFCVPFTVRLGPWKAIVLNGILFGLAHVLAGVPGPENLIGGALLAWAYLKSESIVIPVLLHSGGNFFVLVNNVIVSAYWLS